MRWLDALYATAVVAASPLWLGRMIRNGKMRTDWKARFGHTATLPAKAGRARVLLHGVSVGEINALRLLVEALREGSAGQAARTCPAAEVVVSTTTDTGVARAESLWRGRLPVVRYPVDASWAVRRFLDAVAPDVVALAELEVWPNFVAECEARGIAVCVVNGRLTERSFRRYRRIARVVRQSFRQLSFAAVQSEAYAQRFMALGVPADRVAVTGTMKWDTAEIADEVAGAERLAAELGIDLNRPLVVAGSTAPGEHELLLQSVPDDAQLLCAPRRPEWFDQAAAALPGCVRRSRLTIDSAAHGRASNRLFLLDTIGELRQAYALADVVVVGRSFGALHGSDMMEPIALGKATIVGPAASDFQDTVDALRADDGIMQCTAEELAAAIRSLLSDAALRRALAERGRAVIRANQGATLRHATMIRALLAAHATAR